MPKLAVEAREARREHLLNAAVRCFARKGYHPTTVDDIAAEAGVSKGAPYVYFDSKEALFQELHDSWDCGLAARIEAAIAHLDGHRSRSPRRVLEAIVTAVGAHVAEESDLCRVLLEARTQAAYSAAVAEKLRSTDAEALAGLRRLIEAAVAGGEWPSGADPELHARLILATIHGLMAQWHLAPDSFSWERVAETLSGPWWRPEGTGGGEG